MNGLFMYVRALQDDYMPTLVFFLLVRDSRSSQHFHPMYSNAGAQVEQMYLPGRVPVISVSPGPDAL